MSLSSEIEFTDLTENDLIILFVGPTGSGKSNIIDHLAGLDPKRASTSLQSCTQEIAAIRIHDRPPYGNRLVLVDTPGFDDAAKSDTEILGTVKEWLKTNTQGQIRLSGVIYVQRIRDNRMGRAPTSNLRQFKELCGDNFYKKMFMVTTMWDQVPSATAQGRETQLKEKYWNTMIDKGARFTQFSNTPESAWELVRDIVGDGQREPHSFEGGTTEPESAVRTEKQEVVRPAPRVHLPEGGANLKQGIDANTGPYQYLSGDILVALMGPTGSGKSTIVDRLTDESQKRAGSKLKSCTQEIAAVRVRNHSTYGNSLVLVDTPGFDDTERSDAQILQIIGDWLKETYEQNISLSGILYLHRITDNRMAGTPQRNLRTFGKLCGDNAAKKVLLVTTMWDKVPSGSDTGVKRELELKTSFWSAMRERGSDIGRFYNDRPSAWELVDMVLRESTKEMLLLQEELVLLKRQLNETSAGKDICTTLQRLLAEQKQLVSSLAEQVNQDPQLATQLNKRLGQLQSDMEQILQQVENLRIPFLRRVAIFFSRRPKARAIELG